MSFKPGKIKICHIVCSFEQGGVESLLVDLLNNIDLEIFELHLIVLTQDKIRMVPLLNNINIYVMGFNSFDFKDFKNIFKFLKELSDIIRIVNPDVIHNHLSSVNLLIVVAAMRFSLLKFKHVRTIHSAGGMFSLNGNFKDKLRILIDKLAVRLYKPYLISVSKVVYCNSNLFFGRSALDNKIIYSGIDLRKFDVNGLLVDKKIFNLKEKDLIVTYVSRLEDGKNHEFLLDIWGEIVSSYSNAVLCFAGDGTLKEKLVTKAGENGISDSVVFLGSISQVERLLSISDIAVFPSSFEGFSIVMIEKLAMGLPVVASDIEPFKEIAIDGFNAFLVPLNDRIRFINSVLELLGDGDLRMRMGSNGRLTAQDFSVENTVKSYERYYLACLKL